MATSKTALACLIVTCALVLGGCMSEDVNAHTTIERTAWPDLAGVRVISEAQTSDEAHSFLILDLEAAGDNPKEMQDLVMQGLIRNGWQGADCAGWFEHHGDCAQNDDYFAFVRGLDQPTPHVTVRLQRL